MKYKFSIPVRFFLACFCVLSLLGCVVEPSLTYGFKPKDKIQPSPLTNRIGIIRPLDLRGHAGTTPRYEAYYPFVPFKRIIVEPEQFVFTYNGFKFDYENDFVKLVAMDLQASGIAAYVEPMPDITTVKNALDGSQSPDYVIKLNMQELDWQTKFTMYCLSIVGYVPQFLGYPDSYGFSFVKFSAEIYDSTGKMVGSRSFSAQESQNGWIYYDSGYLRALTEAYEKISPDFRLFVSSAIAGKRNVGKN